MKELTLSLALVVLTFVFLFDFSVLKSDLSLNSLAGVFFSESIKTEDILKDFRKAESKMQVFKRDKIKIMIVPGHDEENSGAQTGDITEAEMNLKMAKKIKRLLEENRELEVFLARDDDGYSKPLKTYINREEEDILEFRQEKIDQMNSLIEEGKIERRVEVHHNFARPEVVKILYGINKYANDKEFDIVFHIHFNDYPGRTAKVGKHNGFAIYVPERQYSNSKASMDFAIKIKEQLEQILPVSSLPKETAIVEDQELIAVGAHNTADPISILVEYGYIYEPYFTNEFQDIVFNEMAKQTYWGIMNYLRDDSLTKQIYENFYDYEFQEVLSNGDRGEAVFALQAFLKSAELYPYKSSFNDCPISGYFGACTENSLKQFQRENNLEVTGILDQQTIEMINPEYLFETIW